jgi:hypothetical protein
VNLATTAALGSSHRFSSLALPEQGGPELDRPPPGAWFTRTPGGFEIGVVD